MIYEFRAWDEEFKRYSDIAMDIKVKDIKYATDYVWEMNTHIKDDNGVEIWQGDIIEVSYNPDRKTTNKFRTEIVWDDDICGFGFQCSNINGNLDYMDSLPRNRESYKSHYKTCKVVGNIHEGVK
jgi:uncharacterized phage protein (TIGR01671 family)